MVKEESKLTISLLNYYLISVLAFLFCSHSFILGYIPEFVVDILRIVLLAISVLIILWTSKSAVEFHGSYAYKLIV
jgi:flagellar biosynthesis component FlhA